MSVSSANRSSQTFVPFTVGFMNDSLLQATQHFNQSLLLQFAGITNPLLITAALFSRTCSHKDSDLGYKTGKMNSEVSGAKMPLKFAEIVIFNFNKVV